MKCNFLCSLPTTRYSRILGGKHSDNNRGGNGRAAPEVSGIISKWQLLLLLQGPLGHRPKLCHDVTVDAFRQVGWPSKCTEARLHWQRNDKTLTRMKGTLGFPASHFLFYFHRNQMFLFLVSHIFPVHDIISSLPHVESP